MRVAFQILCLGFLFLSCDSTSSNNTCAIETRMESMGGILGEFIYSKWNVDLERLELISANFNNQSYAVNEINVNVYHPRLSPDSSEFLFLYDTGLTDVGWGVSLVNIDGSNIRQLPFGAYGIPKWSPDGKKIAYEGRGGYFVYNIETEESINIGRFSKGYDNVSWFPNSTNLVVESYPDTSFGAPNLYSVDILSLEVTQLTEFEYPFYASHPRVNPVTGDILFNIRKDEEEPIGRYQSALMKSDNSIMELDFGMGENHRDYQWSKDGEKMITYGDDSSLDEFSIKMYSFTDDCFEIEGMEAISGNPLVVDLRQDVFFQWVYFN